MSVKPGTAQCVPGNQPSFLTGFGLISDTLALLAPGVPAVGGMAARAVGKMEHLSDAAKGRRLVIGKLEDLASPGALKAGDFRLTWPNQGSPKLNWQKNSSLLRIEMQKSFPIKDISFGKGGGFLSAERNVLKNHSWKFKESDSHWYPPD